MRFACIDIGSNTTRLLVAEPDPRSPTGLREVRRERIFVRLTAQDRATGIPAGKAVALQAAVAFCAAAAQAEGAVATRVVATAALRGGACPADLMSALADAAGAPVEVLGEEEEARLAFEGATAGMARGRGTVAIVDIGGGSTEVAAGTPGDGVSWWASAPVGSGVVTDLDLHGDPPAPAELRRARARAEAAIAEMGCPPADEAWAVGGSATSLRRFVGADLSPAVLAGALDALAGLPAAEAAQRLDLHAERARLLPAALLLLAATAGALGCPLRVGGGGLREGVVLALAARLG
jgi:exopolyphosphatase/guanosine-5'-triphosphate,3'-diphosphate pyrophosphatase